MIHNAFAQRVKKILESDETVLGLAVGGSWLTQSLDEFSDLDLIIITKQKVSDSKETMIRHAKRIGDFISGFTGEHVGEPRVLICLYDNPLLHVDLKFVTLEEFKERVETPEVLLDKTSQLTAINKTVKSHFPHPDFQWIEDRFWTWVHYALLKIGRGEYLEALDFFGFLRMVVLGPLVHVKNGNLPRGVRRVETELSNEDFEDLKQTIPTYERQSLLISLRNAVNFYRRLRLVVFDQSVTLQQQAEERVMVYFDEIEQVK